MADDSIVSMFETEDFRSGLTEAVSSEAASRGIREYEVGIVRYLQNLAIANEPILLEREIRKAAVSRRGTRDAFDSAKVLIDEASMYAISDKRTTLTVADVQKAYAAKFCQVWPFCK